MPTDVTDLTPFAGLTPDTVLAAAEAVGLEPDGHLFALNSYENRVYRIGCNDSPPLVLKFYRSNRWSDVQILEEHAFATELAAAEIPVVAPMKLGDSTLRHFQGFRLAAFPLRPGGSPDLDQPEARELLGRTLGRIHAIGALRAFVARPSLSGERLGASARRTVLASVQFPQHMHERYEQVSARLIEQVRDVFEGSGGWRSIRLHGDCHLGNILWQPQGPVFVDLDDCLNGPAMQDLWMFLSGDRYEQTPQLAELLAGYTEFREFDGAELNLIEALRTLRIMHYAAWLARRWQDPAFQVAFPWFGGRRYWDEHVLALREQIALMDEEPLRWDPA